MPKTILLADDSSTIRKIVELTFNGTDIRVEAFDSGAAALENLDRIEPDLILADVVMPEPTGYELCKQVKALGAGIPVVLLSSTFEPYDEELAAACGADRHLVKPFESGTLTDTVRELLQPATLPVLEGSDEQEAELSQVDDAIEALIDAPESAEERFADFDRIDEEDGLQTPAEELDERLVEAVSKAVVRRLSEQVVREIAREVVPDLAERIIRERIRQLENEDS
ncbi:MAG: response regulator [Acidobacteria bacterium]|nr:response regulator [Acidobacteriota bacterium]NIM62901.1 response regulator [Acidobacteriota bacterium]NIO58844.1 response regulator [Acidobacteriota bacterium]NIQ29901.1 response regulator [Acidobacteriota bacterium]NIQ84625.1 response regulator [Acidobacteriota bacterium]